MDFRRFIPNTSLLEKVSLPDKAVIAEKIKAIQNVSMPDHNVMREQLQKSLLVLKRGLAQETEETKKMLLVYQRYTRGEVTEQELQEAHRQFVSVLKSLGLSIVVILPFSPITLPALVKLGDKLGVDILPDSFKDLDTEQAGQEEQKTSVTKPQLPPANDQ